MAFRSIVPPGDEPLYRPDLGAECPCGPEVQFAGVGELGEADWIYVHRILRHEEPQGGLPSGEQGR
jgi:hypothetical protein